MKNGVCEDVSPIFENGDFPLPAMLVYWRGELKTADLRPKAVGWEAEMEPPAEHPLLRRESGGSQISIWRS